MSSVFLRNSIIRRVRNKSIRYSIKKLQYLMANNNVYNIMLLPSTVSKLLNYTISHDFWNVFLRLSFVFGNYQNFCFEKRFVDRGGMSYAAVAPPLHVLFGPLRRHA